MDKIICVGKNYLDHALELGDPVPKHPVLFLKPPSVLKQATHWGQTLEAIFPGTGSEIIHGECELVLSLRHGGYSLTQAQAQEAIGAITVGLDMTRRTVQTTLKNHSHPWTIAKVFPDAAILGPWIPLSALPHYADENFSATINDTLCQQAKACQMMMQAVDLVVYISQYFPLCAGDSIFTGTPAGLVPLQRNDRMRLSLANYTFMVHFSK